MAYVVFLDESGFLLIPTVRRTWAPCGKTPLVFHRYQRDKISAISAVTVSPRRRHLGLYCHFHFDNITHLEVAAFLRLLLRHLSGHIILLWDGGSIHRGPAVRQLLARHPRLHVERFPAYAPELNPDEQVWNHFKAQLANGSPLSAEDLLNDLTHVARRTRRSPKLLRGFVLESDLPPFLSS
jgi:putative transposase